MNLKMKPAPASDSEDARVLDELISREPIFHRPELGTTREHFERMMAPGFCEIGASGRSYTRSFVLDELEKRQAAPHTDVWQATDFCCRKLAENLHLLTYILVQNGKRRTRRSTIWQQATEGWRIVFHQGTIIQDV